MSHTWYAIQVGKSTSADNKATMFVFIRYIFQNDVLEDMLCAFVANQHYSYRTIQLCEWYVVIHMENGVGHFVLVYAWMERIW